MLVTGATGQVGCELQATVPSWVELVLTDRALLDVTDAAAVQAAIDGLPEAWRAVDPARTGLSRERAGVRSFGAPDDCG